MANLSLSHSNVRLSYRLNGSHVAKLRCKTLTISYGVNSVESHARLERAFYPHRRVQGSFALTFDFIHWNEYDQGMAWFRSYIDSLLSSHDPSPVQVSLDSRNFIRLGYPTTGITHGDHVGSNVFSPTVTFLSVWDPRDATTSLINSGDASLVNLKGSNSPDAVQWFYPASAMNKPGKLAAYLYDQKSEAAAKRAADLQALANSNTPIFPDNTPPTPGPGPDPQSDTGVPIPINPRAQ